MINQARIRKEKNMSQMDLAIKAGTHPSTISRIESGREKPYGPLSERIATALEWTSDVDELFEEVED